MKLDDVGVDLQFDKQGLIPAIVQDMESGQVLMLAYMNQESLQKTLETKQTWFFSRSRQGLWHKGATSGNIQLVRRISADCDGDTLLIDVEQQGNACHTGQYSCFFNHLDTDPAEIDYERDIVQQLFAFIQERKANPVEGSYTNYLFREGVDKICKKIGEESSEVIIGAKNHSRSELTYEISDLIYHTLVLMAEEGVSIPDLKRELTKRHYEKKREETK